MTISLLFSEIIARLNPFVKKSRENLILTFGKNRIRYFSEESERIRDL